MRLIALFALPFCLPAIAQTTVAGSTPGSFRVTETGAAEYRIPIRVPPGIAGMEPKLALAYNSQSGNGPVGMGWTLEGLSAITRCPRTIAQDGARGAVKYDSNDRYCMDGQRLIAISGGYGADGTEYRTERESFAKVISYGTAGNGPAWFKVWTKSGQVMEYGNTADSRIEAQGKTTVRAWAANKLGDTKGNYLTFTYTEDEERGEFYIARIDYTGNAAAGVSPASSVRFTYGSRSDVLLAHVASSQIRTISRLTNVRTYVGETLTGDYALAYDSLGASSRTRLLSVTECHGDCLAPTTFTWQSGGTANFAAAGSLGFGSGGSPGDRWFTTADVNGDGRADIVKLEPASGYVTVRLSTGGAAFAPTVSTYFGNGGSPSDRWFLLADVNGDGKADAVKYEPGNGYVNVMFSNGDGSFGAISSTYLGTGGAPSDRWFTMADVDGDGRADAVLYIPASANLAVMLSNGNGTFAAPASTSFGNGGSPSDRWFLMADVDGDGKADAVRYEPAIATLVVGLSTGNGGFFTPMATSFGNGGSPADRWFTMADVNGDGRADAVRYEPSNGVLVVMPSRGSHEFASAVATPVGSGGSPSDRWFMMADINGDGKDDAIFYEPPSGYAGVIFSTGDGNFSGGPSSYIGTGGSPQDRWFTLADFTGDGKQDAILYNPNGSGTLTAFQATGSFPDLVVSITDGLAAQTDVAYKPLTDGSVHTKDTGASAAAYPNVDLQSPLYVVHTFNASNGIGGSRTATHAYGGLKSNAEGRGFLGFRWTEATDSATGSKARSEFRQDWPYVGMPSLARKAQSSGAVLSQATNTFSCANPATGSACTVAAGNRYFVFVSQSVESGNDLNGTVLPTVVTTTQYDSYGNPSNITVGTGDGHSKTTTNTFTNDALNWLLGRLTRSAVQSTSP